MGLVIEKRDLSSGWVSLAVEGEIDMASVDVLQTAIDSVLAGNSDLVVDLSGSSFMDSTGLKTLITSHRRFDGEGRSFAIAVNGGPVSRLIELSGIRETLRIVERVEDLA